MKITNEIKDDHIKNIFQNEFENFTNLIEKLQKDLPKKCSILHIARDFDSTINQYLNSEIYQSKRGNTGSKTITFGKTIELDDSIIMVFPENIINYKDEYRHYIYFHELGHIFTYNFLQQADPPYNAKKTYLNAIQSLFSEYFCDRFSYNLLTKDIFSQPLNLQLFSLQSYYQPYLENSLMNQLIIQQCILEFRLHNDIEKFLISTNVPNDTAQNGLMHTIANINHFHKDFEEKSDFFPSLLNNRTINLANYFNRKYSDWDFDLEDGLEFIIEFEKNFGLLYEDVPEGLFLTTIDIDNLS